MGKPNSSAGDLETKKEGLFDVKKILKWNLQHSILILLAWGLSVMSNSIWLFPMFSIISILYYLFLFRKDLSKYSPTLGWANIITLSRVFLIILGFLLMEFPILQIVILVIAIVADAFDGKVARKTNTQSDFGLYLDMESDSFFVASVSLLLWSKGEIETWMMVVGFLRYIYVLINYIFSFHNIKEPKRKYASILAGTYFTCLLCELAFDYAFFTYALLVSTISIIGSFAFSFYYQLAIKIKQT